MRERGSSARARERKRQKIRRQAEVGGEEAIQRTKTTVRRNQRDNNLLDDFRYQVGVLEMLSRLHDTHDGGINLELTVLANFLLCNLLLRCAFLYGARHHHLTLVVKQGLTYLGDNLTNLKFEERALERVVERELVARLQPPESQSRIACGQNGVHTLIFLLFGSLVSTRYLAHASDSKSRLRLISSNCVAPLISS